MLAGLPVVAARVSSLPELVADAVTGVLVPPDDPAALADGLIRVLRDPGGLGEAGRLRAQERFSVARMAEATLDVYETVLGRPDVARGPTTHPPPKRRVGLPRR
jgi:starch synthase